MCKQSSDSERKGMWVDIELEIHTRENQGQVAS